MRKDTKLGVSTGTGHYFQMINAAAFSLHRLCAPEKLGADLSLGRITFYIAKYSVKSICLRLDFKALLQSVCLLVLMKPQQWEI
jgi:hypothetical protein